MNHILVDVYDFKVLGFYDFQSKKMYDAALYGNDEFYLKKKSKTLNLQKKICMTHMI